MSENNETLAEIVAEMRYGTIPKHRTDHELLALYADRIEAAHKREVEKLNSVIQATVSRSDAEIDRLRREAEELRKKLGNAAAMRGALDEILETLNKWRSNNEMEHWQYSQLWDIANAALAAPSRQCDVGTAEEQGERCLAEFNDWRRKGEGTKLITAIMQWAQMPYES